MIFSELTREEYISFQIEHKYKNFLNDAKIIDLEKMQGLTCHLLGVKEKKQILVATILISYPFIRGKFHFYYAPRGFLIDYENKELFHFFTKELTKYAKKKGALYVVVDPYILYKERDCDGNLVAGGVDNSSLIKMMSDQGFQHQGLTVGYDKNMQGFRWMYSMSIKNKTKEMIWKEFSQLKRRSIKKTEKYHIKVRNLEYSELSLFENIMKDTSKRHDFAQRPLSFYQNQMKAYQNHLKFLLAYMDVAEYHQSLVDELQKNTKEIERVQTQLNDNPVNEKQQKKYDSLQKNKQAITKHIREAQLLEKKYGGIIPMAVCEFVLYGEEVIYLSGGVYEEFRSYNAPYAIQWHMIQEAIEYAYSNFNFFGITGDFNPNSSDYGVYLFKRGFPGKVEELVGDFVLPIRPLLYKTVMLMKKYLNVFR